MKTSVSENDAVVAEQLLENSYEKCFDDDDEVMINKKAIPISEYLFPIEIDTFSSKFYFNRFVYHPVR